VKSLFHLSVATETSSAEVTKFGVLTFN